MPWRRTATQRPLPSSALSSAFHAPLHSPPFFSLTPYLRHTHPGSSQDPLGSPARRIVGGDLTFPCRAGGGASVTAAACNPADPNQQFTWDPATGLITSKGGGGVLASGGSEDGAGIRVVAAAPGDKAQTWAWPQAAAGGTAINGANGKCLDVYDWAGPSVDTWACNGGSNQAFTLNADGTISEPHSASPGTGGPRCLAFASVPPSICTNVWGRKLSTGYALGLVNNGDAPANITCDSACFAAMNVTGTSALKVRDVWAHAEVASLTPPYSFTASVNGSGFAGLFTLTPA